MRVLAGPVRTKEKRRAGVCVWEWHWEGVDLRCEDDVIPGEELCADHLIERAHRVEGVL